jgi:hypothetical protein
MHEGHLHAIAMLRADNREIETLLVKLGQGEATGAEKEALIGDLCRALTIQMEILEQIAFPAFREAGVYSSILDHAKGDQEAIKRLIQDLRSVSPGDELFDARVKKLAERVKHREARDESDMFPDAEMAGVDMARVGRRLDARKGELMTDGRSARSSGGIDFTSDFTAGRLSR